MRVPYWRLSGYYFFYFAFVGAYSPYFGLYLKSLAFSAWDIALLMSQMQFMRLFAPYLWSALAERRQARVAVVRIVSLLGVAVFATTFFTADFAPLLVAMSLLAFFWSGALPLVEAMTFDHLRQDTGRYGGIRLWGSVGFIVAVLGVGAALDHLPIASLLWMILGLMAGIAALSFVVPDAPQHAHEAHPSIAAILRRAEVRALLAACFFMSAAHGALYVFYSIHLVDHGYSKTLVGWMWTLGVLAEILVFMYMPQLLRRISVRVILLASFAAAVLRFVIIGWAVESLALMLFAQVLHGATFGSYHAGAVAAINQWFPGRLKARGQALYISVSFGAGGLVGGVVSGLSWDAWGAAWTYTLSVLFALAGLEMVRRWVGRGGSSCAVAGV